MDPFFEKQIPELAPAMMWWLVNVMYKKYKREGLQEPPIVQKYTASYWEENDVYGQFIKENLEKAYKIVPADFKGQAPLDETASVSLADMYARFKDWYKTNFSNLKLPDRQIMRGEIETRVTKCVNRAFHGIKFKCEVMDF